MSEVSNVTTGKPRIGGAVYRAPKGTPLPSTVSETLNPAFVSMGYISEDGVTNSNSAENSEQKAWGGDTVLSMQTGKTDTFQMKFLESKNVNVLKAVYGANNVDGSLAAGLMVRANSQEPEAGAWVIDMILRDNCAKRIIIPEGKITTLADIIYKDGEATGYDATITAMPYDAYDGDTHREFLQDTTEPTSPTVAAMAGTDTIDGSLVSTLQTNLAVAGSAITGTLLKQTGNKYYMALKFTNNDTSVTSIKVGCTPGAALSELGADMEAKIEVTNPLNQRLAVVSNDGIRIKRDYYDLTELELEA